jgi:curved DNA-binding protein CbpA
VSLYRVLGVSPQASEEELRVAYRARVRALHPDLHGNTEAAHLTFLELQAAYELLSDPARREAYDRAPELAGEALARMLEERRAQLSRRRRRLRRLYE